MTGARAIARTARDSRGAVLVLVALMLPVLIGAGGLAVDVGNWFAHKRHLQLQADAGALAGAGKWVACATGDWTPVVKAATNYSSTVFDGYGYAPSPSWNPQNGTPAGAALHGEINSMTYYSQPSPADDTVEGQCDAGMVDVKLTEAGLPWFLRLASVDFINAHARIEIKKKLTSSHSLPVGVPEIGAKTAKAIFVNEATGAVIASTPLVRTGSAGGLALWSNSAAPVSVTVNTADIGVRIVLSGSSSTTCGAPLVDCYGAGTTAAIVAGRPGLVHVRGWTTTTAGTAAAPQARDAKLTAGTCEDGYFTATATRSCTVNVAATVDFGGAVTLATSRVYALRTGANANTAVALAPPAAAGGAWTGGGISVTASDAGAVGIDLLGQTGCDPDRTKNCNSAKVPIDTVQRAFAADPAESQSISGPIKLLQLFETGAPGANSFSACSTCSHDLVVKLGLKPGLQLAQSVGDPIVSLKLAGGGSQNQALDCDPAQSNTRDQLANGCGPKYTVNDGSATCPAKSTLWSSPQPWNCVVISTGAQVGQVTQGMNQRILGSTNASVCTSPNHWSAFATAAGLPPGDPRIIEVFLTPFGAFTGSGGSTVPVTGFATFYVTGWDSGPCQGNGDDPAGQGAIVGHYIKTIDTISGQGGGTEFCDVNSVGSCVAQFTR
jgi:Flp pilus assembly protein TadG